MEKAHINGVMDELIQVNGLTITCMDLVYISGLMDATTKDSILKITDKAREFLPGQMVESTRAHGKRAKCMVRELIGTRTA